MKVHRAALWILGEYTYTIADVSAVVNLLKELLGPVEFIDHFFGLVRTLGQNHTSRVYRQSSAIVHRHYGNKSFVL